MELSGGDHQANMLTRQEGFSYLGTRALPANPSRRRQQWSTSRPPPASATPKEEAPLEPATAPAPAGKDVLHDLIALMDAVEYDDIIKTRGTRNTVGLLARLLETKCAPEQVRAVMSSMKRVDITEPGSAEAPTQSESPLPVHSSEWQILPRIFNDLNSKYGPYTIDACSDKLGRNSMVNTFWSQNQDCRTQDWSGHNAWAFPPVHLIAPALEQFLACKRSSPLNTSATFVLPAWDYARWFQPHVQKFFTLVHYFPAYSEVLTESPPKPGEARAAMGPISCPIMVVHCPLGPLRVISPEKRLTLPKRPPRPTEEMAQVLDKVHVGRHLAEGQLQTVTQLVQSYPHAWALKMGDLGHANLAVHRIDTGDAKPVATRLYKYSNLEDQWIKENIAQLTAAGMIRRSHSEYASPPVPVVDGHKGDGDPKPRICFDYRALNAATVSDKFPMPDVDEELAAIGAAKWFSTMDLMKGFYQIPMHQDDAKKTAVITKQGLFEWDVMPFGLKNAPATFQRAMIELLGDLDFVRIHIDDIIIFPHTFDNHCSHLRTVLSRLQDANFKAAPGKAHLFMDTVHHLGHIITGDGNSPDPAKLAAIRNAPKPETITQLRGFLGLANYYRKFVPNFAKIANPLTELTKKDSDVRKDWTPDCDAAMESLKDHLCSAVILLRPDPDKPCKVQVDWQPNAVAAILSRTDADGYERPISFASKTLSGAERNWGATDGEAYAAYWGVEKFRNLLQGSKFVLETDHDCLKYLMTCKTLRGKLARYAMHLQQYDFEIQYRKGVNNGNADGLSRMTIPETDETEDIPGPLEEDIFPINFAGPLEEASGETGTPAQAATSPSQLGVTIPVWMTPSHPPPSMHPAIAAQASPTARPSTSFAPQPPSTAAVPATNLPAPGPTITPTRTSPMSRVAVPSPDACSVCMKLDPMEDLINCSACGDRVHGSCLEPPQIIIDVDWLCGNCDGETRPHHTPESGPMDICEDINTLYLLKHGHHHPEVLGPQHGKERDRVRNRAKRFVIQDNKLYKKSGN